MDLRLLTLKNKLIKINSDINALSEKIGSYAKTSDIQMFFTELSNLLTKNRRLTLRAKQYMAEIIQISNTSGDAYSGEEYENMKNSIMYKAEFVNCSIPHIITSDTESDTKIESITATFKNTGISYTWTPEKVYGFASWENCSIAMISAPAKSNAGYGAECQFIFNYGANISNSIPNNGVYDLIFTIYKVKNTDDVNAIKSGIIPNGVIKIAEYNYSVTKKGV